MKKSDLIKFLEPFSDDIEITIDAPELNQLMRPFIIMPEYKPSKGLSNARVSLNVKACSPVVHTGQA